MKTKILQEIHGLLDARIENAKKAIESAKESRDNDTKSTVGDKHETGRAMMQIEMQNNELQLNNTLQLKEELGKIDPEAEHGKVEHGSLVITSQGDYFISIGIGKMEIDNKTFYAVSLASPVGMALRDKVPGDKVKFQDKDFHIRDIV